MWEERVSSADVRDLQRTMLLPTSGHALAQTVDDLTLPPHQQLYPEVGSAGALKQPGGFRRGHLQGALPPGEPADPPGQAQL